MDQITGLIALALGTAAGLAMACYGLYGTPDDYSGAKRTRANWLLAAAGIIILAVCASLLIVNVFSPTFNWGALFYAPFQFAQKPLKMVKFKGYSIFQF